MKYARRIDQTAPALVKAAKQMGADVVPINGVIDALLLYRGRLLLIDWKAPGGTLTDAQARLTARGWPIHYVSTVDMLQRLLQETR